MLNQKKSKHVFIILGLNVLLIIQSTGALAKKPFGRHLNKILRGSIRSHYNKKVYLPKSAKLISFGDENYFYHAGIFHKKALSGYVVVSAPIGAFILSLPIGYKTVIVSETPYYIYNDTYYVKEGKRFVVIDEIPSEATVVLKPKETPKDSFVVNIPNSNGSYTPVTIKKSSKGFVGPQGEYYTKFPDVEQLKVMYGK